MRLALTALCAAALGAADAQSAPQTDADHYTRYELLAPGSAKFRIVYEVTATTAGATRYFNPIRRGSVASDEAVYDRMTGRPLPFETVNGGVARSMGVAGADSTGDYIMVHLRRAVPTNGEVRLLIEKTYEDARSYIAGGDTVVFNRPLGIKRNAVVLPKGFEVIGANYPSQIRTEPDGRVALSFMNIGPAEVPYVVRGRRLSEGNGAGAAGAGTKGEAEGRARGGPPAGQGNAAFGASRNQTTAATTTRAAPPPAPSPSTTKAAASAAPARAVADDPRLAERAHQDREIVYLLQPPATHAFDLYHDYTESRPGVDKYLNVVRAGSKASNPSARILDTGEELQTRTLRGSAISDAKLDIGEPITPASEVVVIAFTPVRPGESVRLRISETYADPARYRLEGDQLVWDRAFGRPANAMVLPAGWYVTNCSVPATVTLSDDGRLRLDFINPRNDEISVLLTARRRGGEKAGER